MAAERPAPPGGLPPRLGGDEDPRRPGAPLPGGERPLPDAAGKTAAARRRRRSAGIRWWMLAGLGLSLATVIVLAVAYQASGQGDLWGAIGGLDLRYVAGALVLHVLGHVMWAARMAALAHGIGWRMSFRQSFVIITAGVFGAAVTPARVGGDGTRLAFLRAWSDRPEQAPQVLLSDRSMDLLYFIGMGLIGAVSIPLFFGEGARWVQTLAYVGVAIFAVLFGLVAALVYSADLIRWLLRPGAFVASRLFPERGPRWMQQASGLLEATRAGLIALMRERPGWLVVGMLFTGLQWTFEFSILWLLLTGFGHTVSFLPVFVGALLLNIVMALPITPGGSGVAEVAALAMYSALVPGVTPAFVLVWRAVTYYYDLGVGGFVAFRHAALWLSARDAMRKTA